MGYGPLIKIVQEAVNNNENIFYQEAVTLDEIHKYTSSADYGLNVTSNTCLSRYYALPNKLFEYVMARIPLIVSNDYERGNFVKNKKIGFVTKDTELKSIKDVIIKSLNYDKSFFVNFFKKFSLYMFIIGIMFFSKRIESMEIILPYVCSTFSPKIRFPRSAISVDQLPG